jgi:hypothetical protein
MVGVPMLEAERISCSGPKLSDAQTRDFEAIKHSNEGACAASIARTLQLGRTDIQIEPIR